MNPATVALLANGAVCAALVIVVHYIPHDAPSWIRAAVGMGAWYGCVAVALACGRLPNRRRGVLLALAVALVLALDLTMQSWVGLTSGDERRAFLLGRAALVALAVGAYSFILAWPTARVDDPYPPVFRQVWRLLVDTLAAMCVGGAILILLAVLVSLFAEIGVPRLSELMYRLPVWAALTPLALTVGLVLIRRHESIADVLQRHVLTLMAWLLPLVVAVTMVFAAGIVARTVAGGGWGREWTFSLGFFVACWIALANATWQDGTTFPLHPALARWMRRFLLVLPWIAALPVMGVVLRVQAYGWTPPRIWGLVATVSFLAVASGYAYAACRSSNFARYFGRTNLLATAAAMLVIVLLSLPGINVARLVPPDEPPPAYITEPPPAMPALTMLPPGTVMDPALWDLIGEDFAWQAFECAETVAAALPDTRCVAVEIAPSLGSGPLVVFLPKFGNLPPQAVMTLFGKVDGHWRDAGTLSVGWLLQAGLLPAQRSPDVGATP